MCIFLLVNKRRADFLVNVTQTIAVSISKSSIAQGIPVAVPQAVSIVVSQAVPIVAIVGIGIGIGDGFSHSSGVSLSFPLVVVVTPARAVVTPVIAVIALVARPVPPTVIAWPVVRALPFELTTTFPFTLFLVNMSVRNEGADEDEDEDGRETHFEN